MMFDGVSFRRAFGAESITFKRTRIIQGYLLLAILDRADAILTTAGRLQDQRRGGSARGGALTGNSLFSTSVTTWTYPRETSGGQSYATDPRQPRPRGLIKEIGATTHLGSTLAGRRRKRLSAGY
jgi:hypothetical protein